MLRVRILNQLPEIITISFAKQVTTLATQSCNTNEAMPISSKLSLKGSIRNIFISTSLEKYNRKSGAKDVDTDSDDDDNDEPKFKDERDSKVIKTRVNSLRADLLLKAGLGIARNKIENIFYESRIRVNGEKLVKKSVLLNEGDEIDVIRGFAQQNNAYLVVSRVIILYFSDREDGYSVTLRRYKSLLVENYSGGNAFKSSSVSGHLS